MEYMEGGEGRSVRLTTLNRASFEKFPRERGSPHPCARMPTTLFSFFSRKAKETESTRALPSAAGGAAKAGSKKRPAAGLASSGAGVGTEGSESAGTPKADGRQLALAATLSGHMGAVYTVAFAPTGQLLASGSYDKSVRLWAMDEAEPVEVAHTHVLIVVERLAARAVVLT